MVLISSQLKIWLWVLLNFLVISIVLSSISVNVGRGLPLKLFKYASSCENASWASSKQVLKFWSILFVIACIPFIILFSIAVLWSCKLVFDNIQRLNVGIYIANTKIAINLYLIEMRMPSYLEILLKKSKDAKDRNKRKAKTPRIPLVLYFS